MFKKLQPFYLYHLLVNSLKYLFIFFLTTVLPACANQYESLSKEMEEELVENRKILYEAVTTSLPYVEDLLYCFTSEGIPTKPSANLQEKSAACDTTNDPTRLFFQTNENSGGILVLHIINKDFVDSSKIFMPILSESDKEKVLSVSDDFSLHLNLEQLKEKISHKMIFRTTSRVKKKLTVPITILQKSLLNIRSPIDISNETYHLTFLQKNISSYINLFEQYTFIYQKSKMALELLQKISIAFDANGIPQKFTIETGGRSLQGNIDHLSDKSVLFMDERDSAQWISPSFFSTIANRALPGLSAKCLPCLIIPSNPLGNKTIQDASSNSTWQGEISFSKQEGGIYFLRITQQINKILTFPVQLLKEVIAGVTVKTL